MITSMTGYGSYNLSKGDIFIDIEIKSVNSKILITGVTTMINLLRIRLETTANYI